MSGRKIAFYNSTECFSGLEKNTLRFIEWLEEAGNEIIFIGAEDSPMTKAVREKNYSLIALKQKEKYFSLRKSRRLAQILIHEEIRVLFVVRPRNILMTGLTKLLFHRKLILIFFQQSTFTLKPHPLLYKLLFNPFNAWIAPSENIRQKIVRLTQFNPAWCHVIPPCIDRQHYEQDTLTRHAARNLLALPGDRVLLGHMGKYDIRRKQDFLVRAIQLLHKNNYQIDLLIMGHSELEEEKAYHGFLQQLVKECGVEQHVHFRLYSEKMITFFRAIDFFVMNTPSEPYDLSLVKAMASDVPVLALYSDYHQELLGNGNYGLLYKPDNIEDFTAKIIHLLTQPKLVDFLKMQAREQVYARYDKEKSCRKIEELIDELLKKG